MGGGPRSAAYAAVESIAAAAEPMRVLTLTIVCPFLEHGRTRGGRPLLQVGRRWQLILKWPLTLTLNPNCSYQRHGGICRAGDCASRLVKQSPLRVRKRL